MLMLFLLRSLAACLGFACLILNRSLVGHLWCYARALPGTERSFFDARIREDVAGLWQRNRWGVLLACLLVGVAFLAGSDGTRQDQRLTSFTYLYTSGASAEPRMWSLDDLGRWHERDSSGRGARLFDIVKRTVVKGCRGSAASETQGPQFVFFIPDPGCETMSILMSRNGAAWVPLGPITSTTLASSSGR